MGGEHSRSGKHLLLYLAIGLSFTLAFAGCSHVRSWQGWEQLKRTDRLLQEGDHEAALAQTKDVLRDYYEDLGDRALFQMGLLYAYPGNPAPSHEKSFAAFQRLEREFPNSPLRNQAAVYVSILEYVLELRKALHTLEADRMKKEKKMVLLDKELDEKERMIEKYHKNVTERQVIIDRLRTQISELQTRLERVEAQISDLKKVDLRMEEKRRGALPKWNREARFGETGGTRD